jgi:hypothetical protein
MPAAPFKLGPGQQRQLAATIFNHVWDLLVKADRTAGDDNEMLHGAHASRYHWGAAGEPVHWARGEWQCSRVYAVLGRFEPALHHARRCLELATEHDLGPFDVGVAHEAIARSYQLIGDAEMTARHVALGREESAKITDAEERDLLDADLAGLA